MLGVFVFKVREKADDRRTGAKLSEAGEKDGGINQNTSEADFLLCQISGYDKKSSEKANSYPHIVDYRASDTLFYDNTHNGLCNIHPMEKPRNFYPK